MDDTQFDTLSRQVGRQSDRRTMVKTAVGSTLALLGGGLRAQPSAARNRNNGKHHRRGNQTGYEGDECATSDDCLAGLRCEGAQRSLAPGFPTPIDLPVITGKLGRCHYKKSCGGARGDACQRHDDCCTGQNLTCEHHRCKRR